jgi:hypothetical protein
VPVFELALKTGLRFTDNHWIPVIRFVHLVVSACPPNAAGAPKCECNPGYNGTLQPYMGGWMGTCNPTNDGSTPLGSCRWGSVDCNANPSDGCEVNIFEDVLNCGSCGNNCSTIANGYPICYYGYCLVIASLSCKFFYSHRVDTV